jgi:hypothetical protein
MAFFMKDDVKNEVPNGTPKILIIYNGVLNRDVVLKLGGKQKGDHVTPFLG